MRQKFIKQIERKPKLVNVLIMQSHVKCEAKLAWVKHKKEIGISPIAEKDELTDQRERENRELLLLSQMRNDKHEMLAKVGRGDFKRE